MRVARGPTLVVAAPVPLQGAKAIRSCAGAGPYWPTQTLAVSGSTAWVACKEESRLVRVSLPSGTLRPVKLSGLPIAVLTGLGPSGARLGRRRLADRSS